MPRELPVLFNGEMVRAILDSRKTQTRRPVKPQPPLPRSGYYSKRWEIEEDGQWGLWLEAWPVIGRWGLCGQMVRPAYAPGDLLYVRETWACPETITYYRADEEDLLPHGEKWRPSIHMPKWAARIWLRVTGVRVERVQDIAEADARAEGFTGHDPEPANKGGTVYAWPGRSSAPCPRAHFAALWSAAYPGSWERNDWVWVYEFERVEAPR